MGRVSVLQDGKSSGDNLYNKVKVFTLRNGILKKEKMVKIIILYYVCFNHN
jgi:hypothetical protein